MTITTYEATAVRTVERLARTSRQRRFGRGLDGDRIDRRHPARPGV